NDLSRAVHVTNDTGYPIGVSNSIVPFMDKDYCASLHDHVQEAIRRMRTEMAEFASTYHDDENVGVALDWATTEKGLEIVEVDQSEAAQWDEKLQPLVDSWVEEAAGNGFDPQEVLQRATELAAQYESEC